MNKSNIFKLTKTIWSSPQLRNILLLSLIITLLFHNIVATGQAYSKLVQKSHRTAEGRIIDRDVVESYSPIMNGNEFLGAFELYFDVTQRKLTLDTLLSNSTLQMFIMALILMLTLFIVQIHSAIVVRSRDEALQALEKSERRFRNMTSSAQDAIIEMDNIGKVSFWNQAAERIFGISSNEALDQDLHKLIAPQRFQVGFQNHYKEFQRSGKGLLVGHSIPFR